MLKKRLMISARTDTHVIGYTFDPRMNLGSPLGAEPPGVFGEAEPHLFPVPAHPTTPVHDDVTRVVRAMECRVITETGRSGPTADVVTRQLYSCHPSSQNRGTGDCHKWCVCVCVCVYPHGHDVVEQWALDTLTRVMSVSAVMT